MTGLSGGKTTLRADRALLSPVGLQSLTSLDRSVLTKGAEEMKRERVDMWIVAALGWICVLTRGPMFF